MKVQFINSNYNTCPVFGVKVKDLKMADDGLRGKERRLTDEGVPFFEDVFFKTGQDAFYVENGENDPLGIKVSMGEIREISNDNDEVKVRFGFKTSSGEDEIFASHDGAIAYLKGRRSDFQDWAKRAQKGIDSLKTKKDATKVFWD